MTERQSSPPLKAKPGSLRDRIAAFEKPATPGVGAPTPALRPRPTGTVQWKPTGSSPSLPSPGSSDTKFDSGKTSSGINTADAKEAIPKVMSLKERMAALQGKGGFGGAPAPQKLPAEKPKWKPPPQVPVVPAVGGDDPDEKNEQSCSSKISVLPVHVISVRSGDDDVNGKVSEQVTETKDSQDSSELEAARTDTEDEERQRRAAIAARMAKLGGARVGMASMFAPSLVAPKKAARDLNIEESRTSEEEPRVVAPVDEMTSTAVLNTDATSGVKLSGTPSSIDQEAETERRHSVDFEHLQQIRAPISMPMPSAPRRAGPPRKKIPKTPEVSSNKSYENSGTEVKDTNSSVLEVEEVTPQLDEEDQICAKEELAEEILLLENAKEEDVDSTLPPSLHPDARGYIVSAVDIELEKDNTPSSDHGIDITLKNLDTTSHFPSGPIPDHSVAAEEITDLGTQGPDTDEELEQTRRSSFPKKLPFVNSVINQSGAEITESHIRTTEKADITLSDASEVIKLRLDQEVETQFPAIDPGTEGRRFQGLGQCAFDGPYSEHDSPRAGVNASIKEKVFLPVPLPRSSAEISDDDLKHVSVVHSRPRENLAEIDFSVPANPAVPVSPPADLKLYGQGDLHPYVSADPPPSPSSPRSLKNEIDDSEPPLHQCDESTILPMDVGNNVPLPAELQGTDGDEQLLSPVTETLLVSDLESDLDERDSSASKGHSTSPTASDIPLFVPPWVGAVETGPSTLSHFPPPGSAENEKEVIDENEGDPIDPRFHAPSRRTSTISRRSLVTLAPPPEFVNEAEEREASRQTIAERVAKLGGIKLGTSPMLPGGIKSPPILKSIAVAGDQTSSPHVPVQESPAAELVHAEEEDERTRRERIAAKLANMGGMRIGMMPLSGGAHFPHISHAHTERKSTLDVSSELEYDSSPNEDDEVEIDGSLSASLTTSDEGVKVEPEESDVEEVSHEEARAPGPFSERISQSSPKLSLRRQGKGEVKADASAFPADSSLASPYTNRPMVPSSPGRSQSIRKSSVQSTTTVQSAGRKSSLDLGFFTSRRSRQKGQSDYVMVDDPQSLPGNNSPPPLPPGRRSVKSPPSHGMQSSPGADDSLSSQWEMPSSSLDFSDGPDLSLSWTEAAPHLSQSPTSPPATKSSIPPPQPIPVPFAVRQLSPDELMAVWGRVGVQICEVATRLHDKSRKMLIGDGTYEGFVNVVLSEVPNAALPVSPEASYGYLVYLQMGGAIQRRVSDILPGDIVELEDVKLKGHKGLQAYNQSVDHLLGIVSEFEPKKSKVRLFQANLNVGQQTVEAISYRLEDLKSGIIKVYRVLEN